MNKKYKNNVIIEDNIVYKKTNTDLKTLFDFLSSVDFNSFPELISDNKTRYIESKNFHEISKGYELIKTISSLHYKTLYYKEVGKNKYKKIYDTLSNNIDYLDNYYDKIISSINEEEYMSPSHYLFARNYSIIYNSLKQCKTFLNRWKILTSNKTRERVCTLHNNLKLDHFIKGDKNYLISWDNYMVDTPILDLYKFYKTDGYNLDFNYLFKEYNEDLKLFEEEILLFEILILLPPKIVRIKNEYDNTININNILNYMYKTMEFINENKST